MARKFTVDALVLACQQQVDLENHDVIDRAEWLGYISRAYGELWTIVFESGLSYFEYSKTFTTDDAGYLAEPANILSTVSLAYIDSAGRQHELRCLQPQEVSRASRVCSGGHARFFAQRDDRFYLYAKPAAGQTYELRYVPQSPDLTKFDGDYCVDVVTPDGHDFLIWSVAIRAMAKTEADPQLARAERNDARDRFTESVRQRAMTAPRQRVVDYSDLEDDLSW